VRIVRLLTFFEVDDTMPTAEVMKKAKEIHHQIQPAPSLYMEKLPQGGVAVSSSIAPREKDRHLRKWADDAEALPLEGVRDERGSG